MIRWHLVSPTFANRFSHCCKCFCSVLSFIGYLAKFFFLQTKINLHPDINWKIYVDIITLNNTGGNIAEIVHQSFKQIVNVEEIKEVGKVVTAFFSSASLDMMVLFRPCLFSNYSQILECFCIICTIWDDSNHFVRVTSLCVKLINPPRDLLARINVCSMTWSVKVPLQKSWSFMHCIKSVCFGVILFCIFPHLDCSSCK